MKPSLLIVDNDLRLLAHYRKTLEKYGFDVISIDSLDEILVTIEKNHIDCVHIGIYTDALHALSVIKKLDKIRKIPVVAISSHSDKDSLENAKVIGNEYVKAWYNKTCDYEIIIFETLRIINDQIFFSIKKGILEYIGALQQSEYKILADTLNTIPPIVKIIEFKPSFLLSKLKKVLKLITKYIDKQSVKHDSKLKNQFAVFQKLILRHLRYYFIDSLYLYRNLAEQLTEFCSNVKMDEINQFVTKSTIEVLNSILITFENKELTEEHVHHSRIALAEISGIQIGNFSSTPEDIDTYLAHLDGDSNDE